MIKFKKEQIFIVTGASSGLGKATALLLNELGATIVAIARREDKLNELKALCKYPENCNIEIKDLAENIENLPKYVKSLKEKYGKFSGMAYCAGITGLNPIQCLDYDFLLKVFKINYFTPIMMTQGVVDKRNNIGKGTSLVYISSADALLSTKGQPAYSGSKAALSTSIKAISKEVSKYGVRANCVLPTMIKTPMTVSEVSQAIGIVEDNQKGEYPFGWGEPEDVSNLICYLLSDKAKFISGQNYVIDSGGVA